jgi:hypothetical protein
MRESCKSSGASKARSGGANEATARGNPDQGQRHGGDDGADKWGPCGGDRGKGVAAELRKLEEEAASGNYAKAGRPGWAERASAARGRRGAPGRVAGLRGRTGRLATGPFWAESEEKFFSE